MPTGGPSEQIALAFLIAAAIWVLLARPPWFREWVDRLHESDP